MKFYEYVDRTPKIPSVVVIEGIERLFAERAVASVIERVLAPAERDLNLERFAAPDLATFAPVEAALASLPFLGTARVVVLRGVADLRVAERRAVLHLAEHVPEGNVFVIEDLVAPTSKRPEPLAKSLGRGILRIDTTPGIDARERFVRETLAALGAAATDEAVAALASADADLGAVRTDLEKMALLARPIELDDVLRESLVTEDVRAYRYAAAAVAGRTSEALAMAHEMLAADPRGAGVPLLAALAAEYMLVWELARGGSLPASRRWRERELGPVARKLGERRARAGFETSVRGFEAIVTGRADDVRTVVDVATIGQADRRPR